MNNIPKTAKETTRRFERGRNAKTIGGFTMGAAISIVLYVWVLFVNMADKPFFMYKSDIFILSVLFLPLIGFLIYLAIYSFLNQSDYIIVSPKGIEIKMRKASFGFVHDFINWEQIADYKLHELYTGKSKHQPYIFIKLRDENKLRKYHVLGFERRGEAIIECTSQYLEPTVYWNRLYTEFKFGYNVTWREYTFLACCVPCGFVLAHTVKLYEKTFIPIWWWLAITLVLIIIATATRPKSEEKYVGHYSLFMIINVIVCWLFINLNYHFAAWDTSAETRRCEICRITPHRTKFGRRSKYIVKVKYKDDVKDIYFKKYRINELRSSQGVEFDLHKGLFGFDVYKETSLY